MKQSNYTPFNYKNIKMPLSLRIKNFWVRKIRKNNTELQRNFMREMGARKRLIKDRNEIEWFPAVDSALCTGCGICTDFCPRSVYDKNISEKKKATVIHPYECVMLCRGCMPKCPVGAISFPDPEDFKKYVYYV